MFEFFFVVHVVVALLLELGAERAQDAVVEAHTRIIDESLGCQSPIRFQDRRHVLGVGRRADAVGRAVPLPQRLGDVLLCRLPGRRSRLLRLLCKRRIDGRFEAVVAELVDVGLEELVDGERVLLPRDEAVEQFDGLVLGLLEDDGSDVFKGRAHMRIRNRNLLEELLYDFIRQGAHLRRRRVRGGRPFVDEFLDEHVKRLGRHKARQLAAAQSLHLASQIGNKAVAPEERRGRDDARLQLGEDD
mmetsp:Transcript_14857/g.49785  ORF Transcript_14857/g.49785 Transcript_14857/m.49785 type:complete len:245 (-) Transcript_14857:1182-1916(-)